MNYAPEVQKNHKRRIENQFYEKYMSGRGVDIGYRGENNGNPVLYSIGIDRDTPNYDGKTLPFQPNELDYVFSSHCLEHLNNPAEYIKEWYQKTKLNGYIIIIVPHQHLYEKKQSKPSRYNADHKTFYTPAILLQQVEEALKPNTYRVRHLIDNDENYSYEIPPEIHASGSYEIELVLQKIKEPEWEIK